MSELGGRWQWRRVVLLLAAVYNLAWGGLVVVAPLWLFDLAGLEPPHYPAIWQCLGMVIGVYGVGYACAAIDPLRHWPITLVGFLGKVFGPIGFVIAAASGQLSWAFGWTILTNDLIWWLPFGMILWQAWKQARSRSRGATGPATS